MHDRFKDDTNPNETSETNSVLVVLVVHILSMQKAVQTAILWNQSKNKSKY